MVPPGAGPFFRSMTIPPTGRGGDTEAPVPPPRHADLQGAGLPHLLDERSAPDFRAVYGALAARSSAIDGALSRIRVSGLDLRPEEIRSVTRIRLVLAEVNSLTLRNEAEAVLSRADRARSLVHLLALLESERIQVRSAPLAGWAPDFTAFHRKGLPWRGLMGPHWFVRPYPHRGPALASVHGPGGARLLARRFDELWTQAHDIGPALLGLLSRARDRVGPTPGKPRPLKGNRRVEEVPQVLDSPRRSG